MAIQEAGGYCDFCKRPVLGRRDGPNHILHFLITLFSCGLWAIVWLFIALDNGPYQCPTCGNVIRSGDKTSTTVTPNVAATPLSPTRRARAWWNTPAGCTAIGVVFILGLVLIAVMVDRAANTPPRAPNGASSPLPATPAPSASGRP